MFVPLQPVVFNIILCSLASALMVLHSARNERLLRCSAAAEGGYKKAHLTFIDSGKENRITLLLVVGVSVSSCFMRCTAVPAMCCRSDELSCKVQVSVYNVPFLDSPGK